MDQLIDINALVIQTFNLCVVIWVLHRFLFRPYLAFLDKEQLERDKLQKDIAESNHVILNAQKEAEEIVALSKKDAKEMANNIVQNAHDEAAGLREQASRDAELVRQRGLADVEHERKAMTEELKKRVLDVAITLNKKLFGSSEKNEEFLKNAQKDITL